MPTELNAAQRQQIVSAMIAGRKIEAIKLYREFTGQGLREAKDFIDTLAAEMAKQDPSLQDKLKGSGCAIALLFCLAGALTATYCLL